MNDTPDSLEPMRESFVLNPDAIGSLSNVPRVYVGADLRALLHPCECGGMNGYHFDGCEVAPYIAAEQAAREWESPGMIAYLDDLAGTPDFP